MDRPRSNWSRQRTKRGSTTYLLWKEGISTSTSALGAVAPAHGREDVLTYADAIHASVSMDLELLVAASIAHQASDIRDRPFGTDLVEEFWRQHMKANASVGIAQLRPEEVVYWAPELVGQDLLAPEVAIRVMAAKLSKANHYILQAPIPRSIQPTATCCSRSCKTHRTSRR